MKLGVLTVLYQGLPLEGALDKLAALGVEAVELGTGNYPGDHHCNPFELRGDTTKAIELRKKVADRGMFISALSQHGNPLHPDDDFAHRAHETWRATVELAAILEVGVVNAFSGCPGDSTGSTRPNWVTCPWPPDFLEILEWQWNEKVIPYWKREAAFAADHGVRIAFEMHPGFVVYNPETLLRLRAEAGDAVGANYDPSHLFWQGIDAVDAIKQLGGAGAIYHAHAKDTYLDTLNVRANGVLDTKPYDRVAERSWVFRTVGYGQSEKTWRDIMSAFRVAGYDYVLSIEHEDSLLSIDEGIAKAVDFLKPLMFAEQGGDMWWA
ncbi:MAG: sugar phosphate isomerase/epimerase [Actinobacteria bacterium]|jgi:sugar phosphate isomerase/epimerase|nr:sugar phosphate isomerase/epimerase [Actinomycetota bacterium]